jgi:phosphatidylglycerophosphate synthase
MLEQSLLESIESIKNEIINEPNNTCKPNNTCEPNNTCKPNKTNEKKQEEAKPFESWADNNIFFPIANQLVDPLHKLCLTPPKLTLLSTIFTFLSIYFIYQNEKLYAAFAYFTGYLLDCVNDKMSKKNNTNSKYNMALNLVFNNISNIALLTYLINRFGLTNPYILLIIFRIYMLGLSYGVNEAIASQKATGNDNFLLRRTIELKNETNYIFTLFLYIIKLLYRLYRSFFKKYNEESIFNWLSILKYFGPGNYCLLLSIILLFIE